MDNEKRQIQSELVAKKIGPWTLCHVFQGHISKNHSGIVVAQGLHSLVEHPANVKIIRKRAKTDVHGVYGVKLAMTDFKTGLVYRKNSTMFPDTWSKERIINEIESVLSKITVNPELVSHSYFIIEEVSPSGIPLKLIFYNGLLESIYPIFTKKS